MSLEKLVQSISLWPDSPASQRAPQVSAEVRLMIDGSGPTLTGSFAAASPLGCALRMCLDSSRWDSTRYLMIWSARATKRGRLYFRLRRLGRRTSGNGSSSSGTGLVWLTPSGSDAEGSRTLPAGTSATGIRLDGRKAQVGLNNQVNLSGLWMTPRHEGFDAGQTEGRHRGVADSLPSQVKLVRLWPTPTSTAGDGRSEQTLEMWMARRERTLTEKGIHNGLPLNVAAQMSQQMAELWSTPAAQDSKNAALPESQAIRDTLPGDLIRQGSSGKLNPDWVELLQGFPPGWTDIGDGPRSPAKRSGHLSRRARSPAEKPTEPAA